MPTAKEVELLVNRLSLTERLELVRRLERQTWAQRLDAVVSRIRQRAPRLSQQELQRLCRQVRHERTDRARRT